MEKSFVAAAIAMMIPLLGSCNRCPDGLTRIGDECRDLAGETLKAVAEAKAAREALEAAEKAARHAKVDAEERRYQEIKRISAQNKRCEKEGCDLVPTTPNPEDRGIWRRGRARERLLIRVKIANNETITDEERSLIAADE